MPPQPHHPRRPTIAAPPSPRRPYLGVECVTQDRHLLHMLLQVLRGEFEVLTVAELTAATGGTYVRDGICAVLPQGLSPKRAASAHEEVLAPATELLQLSYSHGQASRAGVREVGGG